MKRAIKLLLVYIAIQMVCQFVVSVVAFIPRVCEMASSGKTSAVQMARGLLEDNGTMMGVLGFTLLLSGVLMAWFLVRGKYVTFSLKTFKEVPGRVMLMSLPFIIGVLLTCNLITECLNLPDVTGDTFIKMSHTVWGFLSIAVMAPIVEELLFRGAILGHLLRQGRSPRVAIFLSALLFGIMHFNPVQSCFAFFLGIAFGWLYYRTGSVAPGIVAHAINNTACALLMVLDTEHAHMTVQEQYGTVAFYILLAVALICVVVGYVMLRKELSVPPTFVEDEAVVEEA